MQAMVTGLNGTVAPVLAERLDSAGHQVIGWDRHLVPIDDRDVVHGFLARTRPDWVFHVATGSPDWAQWMAEACGELNVKFLYVSSVSVFSAKQQGPFKIDDIPQPDDSYGAYKLDCERRVRDVCPEALIARLGWQIGWGTTGNQMVAHLDRMHCEKGMVSASQRWFPACSFLDDTADALCSLMETRQRGLYHVDGNPGWSLFEIVLRLNRLRGKPWQVIPEETPAGTNRLLDPSVPVRSIARRLGT